MVTNLRVLKVLVCEILFKFLRYTFTTKTIYYETQISFNFIPTQCVL